MVIFVTMTRLVVMSNRMKRMKMNIMRWYRIWFISIYRKKYIRKICVLSKQVRILPEIDLYHYQSAGPTARPEKKF